MSSPRIAIAIIQREIAHELNRCQVMGFTTINQHIAGIWPGISDTAVRAALTGMVNAGDVLERYYKGGGYMYRLRKPSDRLATKISRLAAAGPDGTRRPASPRSRPRNSARIREMRDAFTETRTRARAALEMSAAGTEAAIEPMRAALSEALDLLKHTAAVLEAIDERR